MKKIKWDLINGKKCISIAEGEGKGNHHMLLHSEGTEVFDTGDGLLIKVGDETEVVHHEHGAIILPANTEIDVFIQSEYTPQREYRKVVD